jgi:hypothetical protein
MAATIKQVRDDCTAAIADLPALTNRNITPRAMWVPQREREEPLPDVIVAPTGRVVELAGRGVRADTVTIQIGICETLANDPEAAASAGHVLADAIIDGLLTTRLAGPSQAVCTAAEHRTLNAPEHWRSLHQFTGVVELTFRI